MTEEKPIDSNGFKLQVRYYIKEQIAKESQTILFKK